ncbi:hypothetical protein PsorP6_010189 [Peronosclerospora sorghi]|uniref:Uncharacterized protein n=1 Tax=Peronosclerospora sorghi TaxID=230839 RepID=A0ACC0VWX5_9STRA|nr:hypothetical protein PsorP6_010189 [Peronosclerospora sorghi]
MDVMTLRETDEDVVAPEEDAYVRHVTLVIVQTFAIYSLRTSYVPFEQHVYARLLQRHGRWYKTTSLFRYFIQERTRTTHPSEQPVPSTHLPGNEKVQKVVTDMITAGLLTSFPATSAAASSSHVATLFSREKQELHQLETALDAIAQSASASELTRLYQKLTGRKKNGTKVVLMEAIKKVAKSQRRLNGSRLPVAPFMQQIWVEGYPLTRKQKTDVMVFQLTPVTRDVIVRMHRLWMVWRMVLVNLFGILIWDVLYAALPMCFRLHFKQLPLISAMRCIFYQARSELIESRLRQVQSEWTIEELLSVFVTRLNAEFDKVTRFLHWPTDDATGALAFHLLTIVAIGQKELTKLLHYMATSREFHQAQNGLPDLLLLRMERSCPDMSLPVGWALASHDCLNIYAFCGMNEHLNLNEKPLLDTERIVVDDAPEKRNVRTLEKVLELIQESNWAARLKVVEVKGPRDRLSDKQRLWLEVLNEHVGLDASMMQVEEPE